MVRRWTEQPEIVLGKALVAALFVPSTCVCPFCEWFPLTCLCVCVLLLTPLFCISLFAVFRLCRECRACCYSCSDWCLSTLYSENDRNVIIVNALKWYNIMTNRVMFIGPDVFEFCRRTFQALKLPCYCAGCEICWRVQTPSTRIFIEASLCFFPHLAACVGCAPSALSRWCTCFGSQAASIDLVTDRVEHNFWMAQ